MFSAERLKEARVLKNFTQKQLAEELSITERSYQRYESSDFEINFKTLEALSDLLDVSIDYLFNRTDNKHSHKI